jgi:hypothetical protein
MRIYRNWDWMEFNKESSQEFLNLFIVLSRVLLALLCKVSEYNTGIMEEGWAMSHHCQWLLIVIKYQFFRLWIKTDPEIIKYQMFNRHWPTGKWKGIFIEVGRNGTFFSTLDSWHNQHKLYNVLPIRWSM